MKLRSSITRVRGLLPRLLRATAVMVTLVIVAAAGAGGSSADTTRPLNIAALGDSITAAWGATGTEGRQQAESWSTGTIPRSTRTGPGWPRCSARQSPTSTGSTTRRQDRASPILTAGSSRRSRARSPARTPTGVGLDAPDRRAVEQPRLRHDRGRHRRRVRRQHHRLGRPAPRHPCRRPPGPRGLSDERPRRADGAQAEARPGRRRPARFDPGLVPALARLADAPWRESGNGGHEPSGLRVPASLRARPGVVRLRTQAEQPSGTTSMRTTTC